MKSTPSAPDGEFESWIAALAGHLDQTSITSTAARRQGLLMRQLIQQRLQLDRTMAADVDDRAVDQAWLRTRAALDRSPDVKWAAATPAHSTRFVVLPDLSGFRRASNHHRYALAAGLLAMALGLTLFGREGLWKRDEEGGEVVMRGDEAPSTIVVRPGASVQQFAGAVIQVLDSHRIPYRRVDVPDGVQIQSALPQDAAVRSELKQLNVSVPDHGRLNLIIRTER